MSMKAQGTIEAIIAVAIGLVVIVIIGTFVGNTNSNVQGTTSTQVARSALDELTAVGNELNSQGTGSKSQVDLSLPADVKEVIFSGNTMTFRFNSGQTSTRSVPYKVYGQVNISEGKNYITAQALDSGICYGDPTLCSTCGDDIIAGFEECEGSNLAGKTCWDVGNFDRGTLSCSSTCRYNTSLCIPPVCGNNLKERGEACDGTDLAGETCRTQGWWLGPLSCYNPPGASQCTFDTSQCIPAQSLCLGVDISTIALEATDNRIKFITATNLCPFPIYVAGANISWDDPTNLLEAVQIDGSVKWGYNCNWGCVPLGRQPSDTIVNFSGTNTLLFTLPPLSSSIFDKIDWKKSVEGTEIVLGFMFNDSSVNWSLPFTPED
ncbi:MAG: hypothetical protein AABX51_04520 [Nanoarchaeota archaeon]